MGKMKMIPFCPLPVEKARKVSRRFNFLAGRLSRMAPGLEQLLKQINSPLDKIEYLSIAAFSAVFMSTLVFAITIIISLYIVDPIRAVSIGLLTGPTLFIAIIIYLIKYPRMLSKSRVRGMEKNLVYGLKHIYIQLRSGVPLFDSFRSLALGGYGMLSDEFGILVKAVQTGSDIDVEMDNLAIRNPSPFLRRALWQISNGIKSGSDMSSVLRTIIENISKEQMLAVRRYGSQLNPLTLVYMMIAVILPALGITMLIVLSSFTGMAISENMLIGILVGLSFMQFMYIGLVKSRRPSI